MARLFQREADRCGSWFNDPHNARFAFRYSCGKAAASPTPLTVCVRAIQARRSGCSLPDRDHAAGLDGTDAGGEQHLHRRASKSRSARTESSGSIANTPDPRSFSQGRWLGEMPPAARVPADGSEVLARAAQCPGRQRQYAPRQHQCDQGFLETMEVEPGSGGNAIYLDCC